MTPEQIEQEWIRHELCTGSPYARCSCGESGEYPWVTREQAHQTHRFAAIAALMPQATERVQWGVIYTDVRPAMTEPDQESERVARACARGAHDGTLYRRTVTSYAPIVGEWEAVDG